MTDLAEQKNTREFSVSLSKLLKLREQNKKLREFFVSLVRSKLLAHSPRNHPVQLWNQ